MNLCFPTIWLLSVVYDLLSVCSALVQATGVVQVSALQLMPLLVAHQKFLYPLE
jgi:hypothetical protein